MFTERYSYPNHADPLATAKKPFFVTTQVPSPEMPKELNSLGRRIPRHWNLGEMELAEMAQDPDRSQSFQSLLELATNNQPITHRNIMSGFRTGYCNSEDIKKARAAIGVGKVVDELSDHKTWRFTEVELAQLLVVIVIDKTYLSGKRKEQF